MRKCSASLKTNNLITAIKSKAGTHNHTAISGQDSSVASPSNPRHSGVSRQDTPTAQTSPQSGTETPSLTELVSPYVTLTPETPKYENLEEENIYLRQRVAELKYMTKALTDKAIDLETSRLTQNLIQDGALPSDSCPQEPLTLQEKETQCDFKDVARVQTQSELERTQRMLKESQEVMAQLKTTIQVLQAEIECLKNEKSNSCQRNDKEWTLVSSHNKLPVVTKNSFQALVGLIEPSGENCTVARTGKTYPWRIKNKKHKIIAENDARKKTDKNKKIVSNILICGDSHARNIARLTRQSLGSNNVMGICKPSARLTDIVPFPSNTSAADCVVLIAGSNDVSAGRQQNLCRQLDAALSRLRHTNVVLSTLPYRHDLPQNHIVNEEIIFANSYIKKAAHRHPQVVVMDINAIKRRNFTGHGQHLRWRGKRQLAELIADIVRVLPCQTTTCNLTTPPRPITSATVRPHMTSNKSGPVVLPHDNYADAVKITTHTAKAASSEAAVISTLCSQLPGTSSNEVKAAPLQRCVSSGTNIYRATPAMTTNATPPTSRTMPHDSLAETSTSPVVVNSIVSEALSPGIDCKKDSQAIKNDHPSQTIQNG